VVKVDPLAGGSERVIRRGRSVTDGMTRVAKERNGGGGENPKSEENIIDMTMMIPARNRAADQDESVMIIRNRKMIG
jgi:hypothetical protein